jgi:hypothetical protein
MCKKGLTWSKKENNRIGCECYSNTSPWSHVRQPLINLACNILSFYSFASFVTTLNSITSLAPHPFLFLHTCHSETPPPPWAKQLNLMKVYYKGCYRDRSLMCEEAFCWVQARCDNINEIVFQFH